MRFSSETPLTDQGYASKKNKTKNKTEGKEFSDIKRRISVLKITAWHSQKTTKNFAQDFSYFTAVCPAVGLVKFSHAGSLLCSLQSS